MWKKISNRIIFSYCIPLACLIGLSFAVYSTTKKVFKFESQIAKEEKILKEADEVSYEIVRMVQNAQGYALTSGNQNYRKSYDLAYKIFQENASALEKEITDPDEKVLADALIEEGKKIHSVAQNVFQRIDKEDLEGSTAQLRSLDLSKIDSTRAKMIAQIDESLARNREGFKEAEEFLVWRVGIASVIATIATILLGISIIIPLRKRLNSLISQVQNSGIQVTTSTTQIAASGKQLEATMTEQVASTHEVTATAREIAATSQALAQTMEQVVAMAETTAIAAGNGQQDLAKMEAVMCQLSDATTAISSKLGVMNEKADNINNVVTTITKVADQTNLLSLNAAIEAEKAGEYGAGFAVVAREIRRLADQTAVATLEIEQMVKEMQAAVSLGVMEMDKFNNSVSQNVEETSKIGEQIAQVIHQVQGLTPRFNEVSNSMEEQSEGAQQISEAMGQLSEASQQTADALGDTNQAVARLDDAAQTLQREISTFREIV